jgi:hypothetical protein
MRYGRAEFGLRYAYLSNDTAPLLDKMTAFFQHHMVELGGEVRWAVAGRLYTVPYDEFLIAIAVAVAAVVVVEVIM